MISPARAPVLAVTSETRKLSDRGLTLTGQRETETPTETPSPQEKTSQA
jgi:hypothetical protein